LNGLRKEQKGQVVSFQNVTGFNKVKALQKEHQQNIESHEWIYLIRMYIFFKKSESRLRTKYK
jgi:hypothetical protein